MDNTDQGYKISTKHRAQSYIGKHFFFSCKKNKRACGQSTNVKFSSFHQTLERSSSVNSFWNRSVVVQSFRLHQAEWQLETVGEKLSTDGGGDPNGNTIACQDNKWPKTLSRQRIQDWRTMSVHMVILSASSGAKRMSWFPKAA